jgi:hypothetical protein
MSLLETNVKNKIALIQEPYTSINWLHSNTQRRLLQFRRGPYEQVPRQPRHGRPRDQAQRFTHLVVRTFYQYIDS